MAFDKKTTKQLSVARSALNKLLFSIQYPSANAEHLYVYLFMIRKQHVALPINYFTIYFHSIAMTLIVLAF